MKIQTKILIAYTEFSLENNEYKFIFNRLTIMIMKVSI